MCGGTIEFEQGASVGVCDSCGTKQTLPKLDDDRRANLYDRANHFRRNNEFDKAMGIYETILNEDPSDAEAYWSLVLCRYGIEYVEDPSTHKRVPTVNRAQYTSVLADEDYKSAIANADALQKTIYEEEAKAIDEIQKGILEISQKEEPFDVFICYKETGADGRRTVDSVRATELYHELVKEGFKVFFSRITLEDKLGTAYEPYIFAALNSAKVMVVLGTKAEHFNAVWVKNEWSRYLSLIKSGAKKTLIPAYQDMDPYDLPEEFSHLQALDMSKLGFMQDLIRGIKKITAADAPKPTVKETVVVNAPAVSAANVAPLLERAFMFLEDGKWAEADEYCEKVLDAEPKNARAYLGKLMAELHIKTENGLRDAAEPFDKSDNAIKAGRFDASLAEIIKTDNDYIRERNETERKQSIYDDAIYAMSSAKTDEDLKSAPEKFEYAGNKFKSIGGFKDADAKAEECFEKADSTRKELIYGNALVEMYSGKTEAEFKSAADKFRSVKGFIDADAQVEACLEKAEVARKDAIYDSAKLKISNNSKESNNEAIKLFESIIDWKDSRTKIDECATKIKDIEIAEEKAEAERKRRAEEARIAAEKRKTLYKRIAMIGGPIVAALVVFLIVLNTVILPSNNYKKALAAADSGNYSEAYTLFEKYPNFRDTRNKIINCIKGMIGEEKYNLLASSKVGDTVIFGAYEQDFNTSNGKEEIEWRVLAKEDNRILIISEYALDCKQYNTKNTSVTWEDCSLRKWLNETFLKAAFSDEEQKLIPSVTVTADANPSYSTSPGNNTEDNVFLLSITEAKKYFSSDDDRMCVPTAYAVAQGAGTNSDYIKDGKAACHWLLRAPAGLYHDAISVSGSFVSGQNNSTFSHVDVKGPIRPAMWIEI